MKKFISVLASILIFCISIVNTGIGSLNFTIAAESDTIAQAYLIGSVGAAQIWSYDEANEIGGTAKIDGDAQYQVVWDFEEPVNTGSSSFFCTVIISPTGDVDNFTTAIFPDLKVTLDEVYVDGTLLTGYDASEAVDTDYYEGSKPGTTRIYLRGDWAANSTQVLENNQDIYSQIKVVFTVSGTGQNGTSNVTKDEVITTTTVAGGSDNATATTTTAAIGKVTTTTTLLYYEPVDYVYIEPDEEDNSIAYGYKVRDGYCIFDEVASIVIDDTGEISSYDRYNVEGDIIVPSELGGLPVTVIGEYAFSFTDVSSVVLPDTVTEIENAAFAWATYLESINIPDNVTSIGEAAFEGCMELKSITIPDSVRIIGDMAFAFCYALSGEIDISKNIENIGNGAFESCENITSFNVDEDNLYYIDEDGVLYNKDKTYLIAYPPKKSGSKYDVPDTVTKLGAGAFSCCEELEEITIPDGVKYIDDSTFSYSGIKEITISKNVESIDEWAFYSCENLESITILNPYCIFIEPDSDTYDSSSTICNGESNSTCYYNGIIYGYENSTAQAYAEKYGYNFESLGEAPFSDVLGDVDGNDVVDGRDASMVLTHYALTSTSQEGVITDAQALLNADWDQNEIVDGRDASAILTYYAEQSVNKS